MTQVSTLFVEKDKDIKIINSILIYKIMGPFIYDKSWLRIGDLDLIDKILIVINIYTLYKILLSRIQLIFVFLILWYVKKFLESKSNRGKEICRKLYNWGKLIAYSLNNDLDNCNHRHWV